MSEFEPKFHDESLNQKYQQELAKITDPIEREAFGFFYPITKKEGINALPNYSWDQFDDGISPFNGLPIEYIDKFVESTNLVPNFTKASTDRNKLIGVVPVSDALKGEFTESLHSSLQESSVRVIGIHPSLASPYIIARSIAAAWEDAYKEDIRPNMYVVTGAYPLTMKYSMRDPMSESGKPVDISPVFIGRSLANLVLTAPNTVNTETDNRDVQTWIKAKRHVFKLNNLEILSKPGNILIVHPSGRRGQRSEAKNPPYIHKEFMPEGRSSYITKVNVPTYVIGISDNLLTVPSHPESVVYINGDPNPRMIKTKADLIEALKRSAELSSTDTDRYHLENRTERTMRIGMKTVTLYGEGRRPNVE
jgi:hypothetical protein